MYLLVVSDSNRVSLLSHSTLVVVVPENRENCVCDNNRMHAYPSTAAGSNAVFYMPVSLSTTSHSKDKPNLLVSNITGGFSRKMATDTL